MKIALAGFYDRQIQALVTKFPVARFVPLAAGAEIPRDIDALVAITQSALDVLFQPENLAACRSLRWVHATQAGIDDYLPHLARVSFVLTCGKVICGPNVADHGMMLLLALTRRLPQVLRGVAPRQNPPTELYRKHALIVGPGGIGLLLAERCAAFGMTVDVVSQTLVPMLGFIRRHYPPDKLMEALPEADVVIIAIPGTPQTRGLIGRDALVAMKEGAYLINVSRGTVIDIDALTEAVRSGRLGGIGLDVTEPEPLAADHYLRHVDRVIITPHYAGMTTASERRLDLIETNIRLFLRNAPLLNVVDPNLGY